MQVGTLMPFWHWSQRKPQRMFRVNKFTLPESRHQDQAEDRDQVVEVMEVEDRDQVMEVMEDPEEDQDLMEDKDEDQGMEVEDMGVQVEDHMAEDMGDREEDQVMAAVAMEVQEGDKGVDDSATTVMQAMLEEEKKGTKQVIHKQDEAWGATADKIKGVGNI